MHFFWTIVEHSGIMTANLSQVIHMFHQDIRQQILLELCSRKELDLASFKKSVISLSDNLDTHAAWCYEHIYSKPYPNKGYSRYRYVSPRLHHGIQHTARTAILVPVFANLYRRYNDSRAIALTSDYLKLTAIAALFHDAGREGEDVDYWNNDSALLLYFYLTKNLQLSHETAACFAEAIANKDSTNKFFQLNEKLKWIQCPSRQKNIIEILLHDADCLDIIRARYAFEAEYLDFYQLIAKNNLTAQKDLVTLICEQRSIIDVQGDSYQHQYAKTKQKYNSTSAYSECVLSFADVEKYQLIPFLYGNGNLLSIDSLQHETVELVKQGCDSPNDLLLKGKVFGRALWAPTAIPKSQHDKTLAAVEIERALAEDGNSHRSISMYGYGCSPCAYAGFLLFGELKNPVYAISISDLDSGWQGKYNAIYRYETPLAIDIVQNELAELHQQIMLGGKIKKYGYEAVSGHNEILYHLTQFDAIFFSKERGVERSPYHAFSPLCEAIFIQQEYFLKTNTLLPIYEYSSKHNTLVFVPPPTENEIIEQWKAMCHAHLQKRYKMHEIFSLSSHELKINSLRGEYPVPMQIAEITRGLIAADCHYPKPLQDTLSAALYDVKLQYIDEKRQLLKKLIIEGNIQNISIDLLLNFPDLYENTDLKLLLKNAINKYISTNRVINEYPSKIRNIFDGYSFVEDDLIKLKNKPLLKLIRTSYMPIFDYKITLVYLLAKTCHFAEETKKIQQDAVSYLNRLIMNDLNDSYYTKSLIAVAYLFNVYPKIREILLRFYLDKGLYLSHNELTLLLSHPLDNLTLKEAYYLHRVLNYLQADPSTKQKTLGQWCYSNELSAYIEYQQNPEKNKLFTNKTNYQLHCFMKSNGYLNDENLRKISFFKAKTEGRKKYHVFAAEYVPLRVK